jgi:hypothetical protein
MDIWEELDILVKDLGQEEVEFLINGIRGGGQVFLLGTILAAYSSYNLHRVEEALKRRRDELTIGTDVNVVVPSAEEIAAARAGVGGAGAVGAAIAASAAARAGAAGSSAAAEEETKDPDTIGSRAGGRLQPSPPGMNKVDSTTRLGRREFRRIFRNFLVERAGASPELVSEENINAFIEYVEKHNMGLTRNINIGGIINRRSFEPLLPRNNFNLPMSEWLQNISDYLYRTRVSGGFGSRHWCWCWCCRHWWWS